jgi:uncharacterized RDD family membrane protein YckC
LRVLIVFIAGFSTLFSAFESVPDVVRIGAFLFSFILYDPIFTSSFGGTIGHMIIGIRVKRERDMEKNILFPFAMLRYLAKVLLGWISLLTVTGNEKKRAIHDLIVGSVVIYK